MVSSLSFNHVAVVLAGSWGSGGGFGVGSCADGYHHHHHHHHLLLLLLLLRFSIFESYVRFGVYLPQR